MFFIVLLVGSVIMNNHELIRIACAANHNNMISGSININMNAYMRVPSFANANVNNTIL